MLFVQNKITVISLSLESIKFYCILNSKQNFSSLVVSVSLFSRSKRIKSCYVFFLNKVKEESDKRVVLLYFKLQLFLPRFSFYARDVGRRMQSLPQAFLENSNAACGSIKLKITGYEIQNLNYHHHSKSQRIS